MANKADDGRTAAALLRKYGKTRVRGPQCALATHPRAALIKELVADGMSPARVAEVMATEFNDSIKAQTISRHGRGECMCPKG